MAIKNQALTVTYFAWDTGNQVGKTGDAANHTMYVSIDGVANAVDDTSSVEVDSTNLQGHYQVTLTADEMNGDHIMLGGESSTSDIVIIPTSITTERGNLATVDTVVDSILLQTGTNGVVLTADAITSAKIADDAIATEHIKTGAITADSIADNAIDAGALASNAITSAKIATGAIDADSIAANAITAAKIATDAIGSDELAATATAEIADAVWSEDLSTHYESGGTMTKAATFVKNILAFLGWWRTISDTSDGTILHKDTDASTNVRTSTYVTDGTERTGTGS